MRACPDKDERIRYRVDSAAGCFGMSRAAPFDQPVVAHSSEPYTSDANRVPIETEHLCHPALDGRRKQQIQKRTRHRGVQAFDRHSGCPIGAKRKRSGHPGDAHLPLPVINLLHMHDISLLRVHDQPDAESRTEELPAEPLGSQ